MTKWVSSPALHLRHRKLLGNELIMPLKKDGIGGTVSVLVSAEVRQAVSKLIVFCAHFALGDGPSPAPNCLTNVPLEVSPQVAILHNIFILILGSNYSYASAHFVVTDFQNKGIKKETCLFQYLKYRKWLPLYRHDICKTHINPR